MSNTPADRESKLSRSEVVSYGLGDMSASLAWNAVAAFALYFYTDIALLPAAAIGTLFFVSRIADAVFDLGIGAIVDRTRTRWGKARPYLLFAAVPFGLFTVLTFLTPDASESARFYYATLTYFILGLLLSVVNIPYSALLPMMSRNLSDRVDLSVARAVGTSLGVIAATAVFLPGVRYFGRGDEQRGFLIMALIISVLSTLMLLTTFANCRERYADETPPPTGILADVGMMFRNQAWLSVSGFALLNFVRFGGILALTPFFAINVLGHAWMISVLLPTLSGTMLVGAFIARPILRRFGMKRTDTVALMLSILLYLVLPFAEGAPWPFIGLYVLAGLVTSITMTSIYAMASESVDYHELIFGIRQEGLLASGVAFSIKVGMAFGSAAIAYALALGGYDPADVTDEARSMMSWLYYGLPIVVYVLQIICVQYYPVDGVRDDMKATIDARKPGVAPS
jgi:glycoside/pentoside/hexuronide:cation symporter, GPH family